MRYTSTSSGWRYLNRFSCPLHRSSRDIWGNRPLAVVDDCRLGNCIPRSFRHRSNPSNPSQLSQGQPGISKGASDRYDLRFLTNTIFPRIRNRPITIGVSILLEQTENVFRVGWFAKDWQCSVRVSSFSVLHCRLNLLENIRVVILLVTGGVVKGVCGETLDGQYIHCEFFVDLRISELFPEYEITRRSLGHQLDRGKASSTNLLNEQISVFHAGVQIRPVIVKHNHLGFVLLPILGWLGSTPWRHCQGSLKC
jgi:hypothetical protein